MLSDKLYNWVFGYLKIEISGRNPERFLNLALQEDILIEEVVWQNEHLLLAVIRRRDLPVLKQIAAQIGCKIRTNRRTGLPFLFLWVKKRWSFVLGAAIFVCGMFFISSLIFWVEVDSPLPLTQTRVEEVEKVVMQSGVELWHSSWFLDFNRIKQTVLQRFSALSWIEMEVKSNKLYIHIVEKDLPPEGEVTKPVGNILALKDGIVEEILVTKGTAAVKPGDTVMAGQVLIYGNDGQKRVTASGIVRCRVWYSSDGTCALTEEQAIYTGQKSRQLTLTGADWQFIFSGPENNPYITANMEEKRLPLIVWRKIKLPVELIIKDFYEQNKIYQNRTESEALAEAEARARNQLQTKIAPVCEVISLKALDLSNVEGIKCVRLLLETKEDIGTFVPLPENQ